MNCRIMCALIAALAVLGGSTALAQDLSQRGKQLLDRFDQRKEGWEVGKPILEMVPERDRAPDRRQGAIHSAQRVIDDAAGLHRSLAMLMRPFPEADRGHARYKAAMKWLDDFAAQIERWKHEREELIAADRAAAAEQKQLAAAYKAEAEAHKDLLGAVGQASLQVQRFEKEQQQVNPVTIQSRPTEIFERAARLEAEVVEAGALDQMAQNCREKYVNLPVGWAPRCQEAVFARRTAASYRALADAYLKEYEKALATRVCPAGSARNGRLERALGAAFRKANAGYDPVQVRMTGPVTTQTGVGTVTELAPFVVCFRKRDERPPRCGSWPLTYQRHRAGRGPWSAWEYRSTGAVGDLLCANVKK